MARKDADEQATAAEEQATAAEVARKDADEQATAAALQRDLAIGAFQSLVQDVQSDLKDNYELHGLKIKLLETAIRGLNQVAANAKESVVTLEGMKEEHQQRRLRSMAGALQRMGDIYIMLGHPDKALQQFQQCEHIVRPLAKAVPDDANLAKRNPAVVCDKLGLANLRLGNSDAALEYYRESLQLRKEWMAIEPESLRAKEFLEGGYQSLASALMQLGDPAGALQFCQDLLGLRKERRQRQGYRWRSCKAAQSGIQKPIPSV